ncbi:MAG: response regulator, partial [Desulfatitalea sp.]|nr:response regulator [Desulfatitalea sp.]
MEKARGRQFKILIVDRNDRFREVLKQIIWTHYPRARILEAGGPVEALRLALTQNPALIMLEIDLHGASGLDLARQIRAHPIPSMIAVVTQDDLPEYEAAAYQRGADRFVSKCTHNGQT